MINNELVREISHKCICSNWKTYDLLYESTNTCNEVAKDSGWNKLIIDSFNESSAKSFESHNEWSSLSKPEINHSSWNSTFKTENNTSNNWIARGTKIESSWSANGEEKNNHSYDCNENPKYFPYNNRSYHQIDRYPRHYNSYYAYQPRCSNQRTNQQNRFTSNSETKVKTSYINKYSNDELYNLTHNCIERKKPNTICYI